MPRSEGENAFICVVYYKVWRIAKNYNRSLKGGVIVKLIFAIVNNDDSHSVQSALTKNGVQATKLASSGGFLMAGNTTFMICSEDEKLDDVIEIIRKHSHKRKQFVPNSASYGVGSYASFPVEVCVGGATIFVTNVERFEKV